MTQSMKKRALRIVLERDRSREGVIKVPSCWYFVDGRNDLD